MGDEFGKLLRLSEPADAARSERGAGRVFVGREGAELFARLFVFSFGPRRVEFARDLLRVDRIKPVEHFARRDEFARIERFDVDEFKPFGKLAVDAEEGGIVRGVRAVYGNPGSCEFEEQFSGRVVGRPFFFGAEREGMMRDNTVGVELDRFVGDGGVDRKTG